MKPVGIGLLVLTLSSGSVMARSHYVAPDASFSIDFPTGWVVDEGVLKGTLVKARLRDLKDTATIVVSCAENRIGVENYAPRELYDMIVGSADGAECSYLGSGVDTCGEVTGRWLAYEIHPPALFPPRTARTTYILKGDLVYTIGSSAHPRYYKRYRGIFAEVARSFRAPAAAASSPSVPEGIRYVDSLYGFSLTIPKGWVRKGGIAEEILLKLVFDDGWARRMLLVSAFKLEVDADIGDLSPTDIRAMLQEHPMRSKSIAFRIDSVGRDTVAGRHSLWADFTYSYIGPDGDLRGIRTINYYFEHRGHLMIFHGTLGKGGEEAKRFRRLLSTLEFHDNEATPVPGGEFTVKMTPGMSAPEAHVRACGTEFIRYLLVAMLLGLGGWVWRRLRRKTARAKPDEASTEAKSDPEQTKLDG